MKSSAVGAGLYRLDPRWQVHFPKNGLDASSELNLSPGEAKVLAILETVHDRSTGSEELIGTLEDADVSLHLSPARVNFLRPFSGILSGDILQIGAESAALARFLGDSGCSVDCLEGHKGRAVISAVRCKDLPNIRVYAGGQEFLGGAKEYDSVITTGSGLNSLFSRGHGSLEDSLKVLRKTLKTGGFILAAFENRLSLKSASRGLTARPEEARFFASTRSKHELEQAFQGAGFQHVTFYNLFPDYESARVVGTPECGRQHLPMLESILAAYTGRTLNLARSVWKAVLDNGLLSVLSDAFVVLAFDRQLNHGHERDLLHIYSTLRKRHFAGEATVRNNGANLAVVRSSTFPHEPPPSDSLYRRRDYQEPYIVGHPYVAQLQEILSAAPWHPSEVSTWAGPWLKLLDSQATLESSGNFVGGLQEVRVVPNSFVDCIPSNIVVDEVGALHPFDFEYEAIAPILLKFVVFRGLFYSFRAMVQIASPIAPFTTSIIELIGGVFQASKLPLSEQEMETYIGLEAELQETVAGVPRDRVRLELRSARLDVPPGNQIAVTASAGLPLTVQLFWKSSKGNYSADDCVSVNTRIGPEKQTIRIPLPVLDTIPEGLRLDPADRPGLFYIYSLWLLDAKGAVIWSWDGDSHSVGSLTDLQLLGRSETGGSAAYSESNDPHLELPTTSAILSKIEHGGSVEIEMAWPTISDYTTLVRSLRAKNREQVALLSGQVATLEAETTNLHADKRRIETLLAETQDVVTKFNSELNESRSKLMELSHERTRLEGANWALQFELSGWRKHVERLARQVYETRQEREAMQELNRQLQAQLRETKHLLDELDAKHRLDDLEKSVKGIYQSRIWRTLVALSSPLEKLFRPGRK